MANDLSFIRETVSPEELPEEARAALADPSPAGDAQRLRLALEWLHEEGLPVNERYAARLLEPGASHADPDSMYELGMCYRWGDGGVWADPDTALMWLKKAADAGHAGAAEVVSAFSGAPMMLLMSAVSGIDPFTGARGDFVKWYKSRELTLGFYRKACDGDAEAQYELARQLENLRHVGPFRGDIRESIRWYTAAARSGVSDAAFNLAMIYRSGKGLDGPDPEAALKWMRLAAALGDREAASLTKQWMEE